eukprot:GEZU01038865.1.p1 GENE.GEZU01038865.1~~GEZU01038865.1.p1  ORF type:complete len:161 (+),score=54.50 GEZU01038865.1:44-526(+)
MSTRVQQPTTRVPLDGPPPGGYPPVRIRANLPNKGFSAFTLFCLTIGTIAYGHYRLYLQQKRDNALLHENKALRTALRPFLQAELDIATVVNERAVKKKIDKLMADDPNYDPNTATKFYNHTHRYAPRKYPLKIHEFDGIDLDNLVKKKDATKAAHGGSH